MLLFTYGCRWRDMLSFWQLLLWSKELKLSAFILCNFHVCKWEEAWYIKDLKCLKFFKEFLEVSYCHSVLSGVRKLFRFLTSLPELHDGFWWNLVGMKYSWYLQVLVFFGQIHTGVIPGRDQNRSGGPFLQRTSSSDCKATVTNQMYSNDQEACRKEVLLFFIHSEVKFCFWTESFLAYFNVISI